LLEALYKRQGVFADTPEERWRHLIYLSASNTRLVTEYDYEDMPDMGHYDIHKSIFELLGTAPVDNNLLIVLYHLLDQLDPQCVHSPENLDHVLKRWAQLPVKQDTSHDGYFTSLPLRDEFRCLIAALYGRGFGNKTPIGRTDEDDVALRCAYYARAEFMAKDMTAGYEKDGPVFTFAAMLNSRVHQRRDLRKLMEEDYRAGG